MRTLALVAVVVLGLLAPACSKTYNVTGTGPDPTSPTAPALPALHTIEYRALGTIGTAHVTYGNAQDGTTDFQGAVPWSASTTTRRATLFVYIDGEALAFGEIRVQIFVDGQLFREATAENFGTAQASGTLQLGASSLRR